FALTSPRTAFVAFAMAWSALVALIVGLALARRGAAPRAPAIVATFLVVLGLTLSVGALNSDHDRAAQPQQALGEGRLAAIVQRVVRQRGETEPGVEHYHLNVDRDLSRAFTPANIRVRPTFYSGQLGYEVRSDLADGVLTSDGFTVTDPRIAAAVG